MESNGPGSARPASRLVARRCEPHDLDAVRAIYAAALAGAAWLPPAARVARDFDAVSAGEAVTVVCDAAARIVGFVSVFEPDAFIHHLYVAEGEQRRGAASALLRALDGRLPRPWRLKCVTANVDAMAFYRARGWCEESRGDSPDGPYALLVRP